MPLRAPGGPKRVTAQRQATGSRSGETDPSMQSRHRELARTRRRSPCSAGCSRRGRPGCRLSTRRARGTGGSPARPAGIRRTSRRRAGRRAVPRRRAPSARRSVRSLPVERLQPERDAEAQRVVGGHVEVRQERDDQALAVRQQSDPAADGRVGGSPTSCGTSAADPTAPKSVAGVVCGSDIVVVPRTAPLRSSRTRSYAMRSSG